MDRACLGAAGWWGGILYLGVFGTVLAFVFFYEGIQRIGAARATAFAFLVPVFGVGSPVLMLSEELAPLTIIGGALVLVGLWLVQRQPPAQPVRISAIDPVRSH